MPSNPFVGVGTILFNMVVNPNPPHKIYVSNTDAQNHVRFEGPGTFVTSGAAKPMGEPASVKGDLAHSRISVLDPSTGSVAPRHLNLCKVSIYAGSNEIQRTVMAKRILGL